MTFLLFCIEVQKTCNNVWVLQLKTGALLSHLSCFPSRTVKMSSKDSTMHCTNSCPLWVWLLVTLLTMRLSWIPYGTPNPSGTSGAKIGIPRAGPERVLVERMLWFMATYAGSVNRLCRAWPFERARHRRAVRWQSKPWPGERNSKSYTHPPVK